MRKEIDFFENPLACNLSRQEETNQLINKLSVFIENERIKKKVISFIQKERNTIVEPEYFLRYLTIPDNDKIKDEKYILLGNLIKVSPLYKTAVSDWRKYRVYCLKLFSIGGLYSLEDSLVRFYIFTFIHSNKELKKKLKDIIAQIFLKSKIKRISIPRKQLETRMNKFLCSSLHLKTKKSYSSLGRMFGVNKDTIKNWINEAETWPPEEREAIKNEITSSKSLSNIDLLDLPRQNLVSFSNAAYSLTSQGNYKNGKKLKPKIPYDKPQE